MTYVLCYLFTLNASLVLTIELKLIVFLMDYFES